MPKTAIFVELKVAKNSNNLLQIIAKNGNKMVTLASIFACIDFVKLAPCFEVTSNNAIYAFINLIQIESRLLSRDTVYPIR